MGKPLTCDSCLLTEQINGGEIDYCELFSHCALTEDVAVRMLAEIKEAQAPVIAKWNLKLASKEVV